jgi:hypothetical protein
MLRIRGIIYRELVSIARDLKEGEDKEVNDEVRQEHRLVLRYINKADSHFALGR